MTTQLHASCIELAGVGILLRGPSGSGKSDLALRLIDAGARLVADDRTDLALEGGRLIASAPAAILGRIEVRGVGLIAAPFVLRTEIALAVDLVGASEVERLPAARRLTLLGFEVALIALAPFEASAAAKLGFAARAAARGRLFAA
ncbi:MAG: HPr kinase/phosphorylase [Pseudomonadota bacterium]